jgi:hypothetical protein
MKGIFIVALGLIATRMVAQEDPCQQKLMSKEGNWAQVSRTERAAPADLAIQKKFTASTETLLRSRYKPRGVQAKISTWHEPINPAMPVSAYGFTLYAMHYRCINGELKPEHETSTKLAINFNLFTETDIFDTTTDYLLSGFNTLRHGLPAEIQPGIWQFPDDRASLGFGVTGNSKLWLLTHDGKLPWSYVSRREFLVKRKQNLQRQLADEEPRYKEQLQQWNIQKKYKEQELKNDASKLQTFITVTYNPAIERLNQNYQKSKAAFQKAIQRVEEQLAAPALDKPAIVIKSSKNHLDYDFTDKAEPFAEVLVKPNPAYFNKMLGRSSPQLITVQLTYNHKDPVAARFAEDVSPAIDLAYLKSFIGKNNAATLSAK